jgi:hypothetical protein
LARNWSLLSTMARPCATGWRFCSSSLGTFFCFRVEPWRLIN